MIFNQEQETMAREDMIQLQIERLQSTLNRVYRNVAFYKSSFDEAKVDIGKIREPADMKYLPFTTRDDLMRAYPYDMFAVPLKDIVRIHSSSGTTGRPIVSGYTRNDLRHWAELVARLLAAVGVTEHDFVQIAFDYSLFTGGFGFHYGAEQLGASVIPSSADFNFQRQIYIMRDYKTSVLLATPSYALALGNHLESMGVHPDQLDLRVGLFGAEPWSEELRSQIENKLHVEAYDNYGLSEIMGPGVSGECEQKHGLHLNEDHFLVEVIDPGTLQPVAEGETGELVITNLTKEGCPLIRYRTGDLAAILPEPCACGRTTRRMSRVTGRCDDLIIHRGSKLYPTQIEQVLLKAEGILPHYRIVTGKEEGQDSLEIQVEVSERLFFDEIKKMQRMKDRIARMLEDELGITARISFVEPQTLRKPGR